jgi:hypothetical protein
LPFATPPCQRHAATASCFFTISILAVTPPPASDYGADDGDTAPDASFHRANILPPVFTPSSILRPSNAVISPLIAASIDEFAVMLTLMLATAELIR